MIERINEIIARPHHVLQEIIRGKGDIGSVYSSTQIEAAAELNEQVWRWPDDTRIQFTTSGERDACCANCPRHPERFEANKRFAVVCDLEAAEQYDLRIIKRLVREVGKPSDQITLGDLRQMFPARGRGHVLGLDILESDVPARVLDELGIWH